MTTAMVISGTVGWFVLETEMPATSVVFWRCGLGALAMLMSCAALGLLRWGVLDLRQLGLAALGGIALVINWVLLFTAYSYASIAVATITYHTQPFMLVALGALCFAERLSANQLGWLGLAFCGVVLIIIGAEGAVASSSGYLLGIALALAAALSYAIAAAITKGLAGVPAQLIVLIQLSIGSVALLPFARSPVGASAMYDWGLLLTIGFVHTGLMSTLLYAAIQKISTSLIGVLSFIYPVVAILIDAWAFGHWLSPAQVGGAVAILIAVAGMNFGWRLFGHQRGHT